MEELIRDIVSDKENTLTLEFNSEWAIYENQLSGWRARYYPKTPVGFVEATGTTAEEAVKNLWLELKKERKP